MQYFANTQYKQSTKQVHYQRNYAEAIVKQRSYFQQQT